MMKFEKWENKIQDVIDVLDTQRKSVEDRMGLASSAAASINALFFTLNGWRQWFGNYQVTNMIDQDDLIEIEVTLYQMVRNLLKLDYQMTKKYHGKAKTVITADHGVFDAGAFTKIMKEMEEKMDERYIS